jgi:hypothetical protein
MTRPFPVVLAAAALAVAASLLEAQVPVRVRGGGFYESYSFDPGLPFRSVSEVALPLTIDVGLGRYATLTLSSGFVSVSLERVDSAAADQTLSGALDTELRLGVNVIPGRLIVLASGALPTGITSVEEEELTILAALASDVVGFAVPSVGSGGTLGGGVVGAIPLGRFALGLGATYTHALSYQPVVGQTDEIRPAAEIRGRAGIEGPLGRTTYLRVATVVARRGKDEFAGASQNGVGMRFIGYGELAQGFGNLQLTLYGYDVYRGSPQLEATAVGQAILPKGNLIVSGLRFSLPVTRTTTILPRAELRYSSQAQGAYDSTGSFVQGPMEKAGTSWRFGVDLRQHLAGPFAMVASGGVLTGNLVQADTDIGLSGYRFGLLLEVTP